MAPRFPETIICDQCNAADGRAKRHLGLPERWSFAPAEIAQFVTATPHGGHVLDLDVAAVIYRAADAAATIGAWGPADRSSIRSAAGPILRPCAGSSASVRGHAAPA